LSAPRFLVPVLPDGDVFVLDGPEGHHAATVQRLRVGERLVLCDGTGGTVSATVVGAGKGSLELSLGERSYESAPDPRLVVVQGIAKGDRGELAVQAMTEVGVDAIVPWAAVRSVARWTSDKPRQRWADTAREAAKQARRTWVPPVAAPVSTKDIPAGALVLHSDAALALSAVPLPAKGDIVLVVGPEGGIAPEELAALEQAGAKAVRLGPSVLRTSTAGPAALAVLSARLGRW
jgi:16S rRNA (uracil1498-N3)-methyltransferase